VSTLLLVPAILSLILLCWQWVEAWRFPLHRQRRVGNWAPSLSLLKPLKGCDAETETCLRSWLAQDYPGPVQVLFLVATEDDPAAPLVRRLIAEHPSHDLELVVCPRRLGPNSKVSKLAQASARLKHDVVVVSDADVQVPRGFLADLVAPLREDGVVLVNPFYELATPTTAAMRWEAVAVNADFWSSVLQARRLGGLKFALGAVMAVRRDALEKIGGFAALVNHLADDYELGKRVVAAPPPPLPPGMRLPASDHAGEEVAARRQPHPTIALCPTVAACREAPHGWMSVWRHQLRWARTIRHCQPLPYAFSLLSNSTLWPLAWFLTAPTTHGWRWAGLVLALGCRMAMAAHCQWKLTRSGRHLPWLWIAPVKDLLQAALWLQSFLGRTVEWRGERYRVLSGGELDRLPGRNPCP